MQWNIRGVVANGEELQILLSNFNPEVVFFYKKRFGSLILNYIRTFDRYQLHLYSSEC